MAHTTFSKLVVAKNCAILIVYIELIEQGIFLSYEP